MVIIGAKGHAKEILDVLEKSDYKEVIYFFDNINNDLTDVQYGKYELIRQIADLEEIFRKHPLFILGVGNPQVRQALCQEMEKIGGLPHKLVASTAIIGNHNVELSAGINIMHKAMVSNDVLIGKGTLINAGANIHHDSTIGNFCEISPGAIITGNVKIGDNCTIGSGAIILPKVEIGRDVIVGAGAVVTKDLPDNVTALGIPAKAIR